MLQKFAFVLVLLLLIPDLYIYVGYLRKRPHLKWAKWFLWLPTILLILAFFIIRYVGTDNAMSERSDAIAWLAILMMAFGFPKLVFMFFGWLGDVFHQLVKAIPHKLFTIIGAALGFCIFCIILFARIYGIRHFVVNEIEMHIPNLPKGFEGYRIVQISDIHSGSYDAMPDIVEKLVKKVNEQKGDLILFTGDLVNQRSHEVEQFMDMLDDIQAPDGVYSILGNHDYGKYFKWADDSMEEVDTDRLCELEEKMGWKMLRNEHDVIYHNGDSIAIIGVENEGRPPFPQKADLPRAMKGTEGMTKILLSHDPTHWRMEVLPNTDIDLMLAGHTHAAQFIMFGWSPAQWTYDEWGGLYKEGNQQLYVNVGIGYVGLPFRFGAWPEITVFTLQE